MSKDGWVLKILMALIAVLVVTQLALAMEVLEAVSIINQISGIDEKTAMLKNEAAVMALESERIRNNFYRVYSTSPFVLTEEEARGIIRRGVKRED